MATIDATSLVKLYAAGDPLRVVLYAARDITAADTIDVSADFTIARVAAIMGLTTEAAASCAVTSPATVTIPPGADHDIAWIMVWGSSA